MLGWVWSCAQCVSNAWLMVFVGGDVGATDSAGRAGIRFSGWLL